MDYVFYLFSFNDIEDISNTRLFRLDAGGELNNDARPQSQRYYDIFLKARAVVEQEVRAQTVDLLACAEERIPGFKYETIRFRNDAHWHEAGNMLAARCLYRFIERGSALPRATEAALSDRLLAYYSAFRDDGGSCRAQGAVAG